MNIAKQKYDFKGYTSFHTIETFNPFNPKLQLKDTESAIKVQ